MRSALIDTLGEDFIRTARAKGLTARQALCRHALRNALIPVLTIIGLQFSFLLAGAIIIENVFFLPGLGRLVFQAIGQRDLIVVQSVVMLLVVRGDPRHLPRRSRLCAGRPAAAGGAADARRSPSRRRDRWRCAAVAVAALLSLALDALRRGGRSTSPASCSRPRRRTGSAPTISAATCCRC